MIVNKYNKGGGGDMSQYWTSAQTESAITAATEGLASEEYVDEAVSAVTSDAPTKTWVTGNTESMIATAMAAETARTENTYAKPSQIPSLAGYATEAYVDAAVTAGTQNFVTSQDVDSAITAATQDLASKAYVTAATQNFVTSGQVENQITAATQGMATESWVQEQGYAVYDEEDPFATQSWVQGEIPDISDYYTKSEVDAEITGATEGMATESWVQEQGFVTDLSDYYTKAEVDAEITGATQDYATEAYVDAAVSAVTSDAPSKAWVTGTTETMIGTAMAAETARTESTYAKPSQIPSLTGYATENYVDAAITSATQNFITSAYTGFTTVEDFESFAGQMEAKEEVVASALTFLNQEVAGITPPDMSDYYTKDEVDAEVTGATQGFATQAYVTAATQNLASQAYVTSAVTAATQNMATQAYVTGITSPMQTQINNKVTNGGGISTMMKISQSDYNDLVSGGTVDNSTFYVITGQTSN